VIFASGGNDSFLHRKEGVELFSTMGLFYYHSLFLKIVYLFVVLCPNYLQLGKKVSYAELHNFPNIKSQVGTGII
jgi:hypothetical protein